MKQPEQKPHAGAELRPLLALIAEGRTLSAEQAEAAFGTIMEGHASDVQIAALLMGLRARGELPAELAGGVRALRAAMVSVASPAGWALVDTCGTGGGRLTTFNISTAAALVSAGAGVRVAKHGNRSFTSRCGSADVLEALGVVIELTPEQMARVLEEAGIVFMFAPLLHPAMRHVAPVRRALAVPTLMNLIGPLANPAGATRQVIGVSDPASIDLMIETLRELDHERAMVVYGEPGMDELSPVGATDVAELAGGRIRRYRFDPVERLGWDADASLEGLGGGDPTENARRIENVLAGRDRGTGRAAVVLNAAAAVYVGGLADSLEEGVELAERAIDDGGAGEALRRLRQASSAAAERTPG